mgnify:CR=1 FL=1
MKQTFVKAAVMACFMAAVSCGQAPTEQGGKAGGGGAAGGGFAI